MNLEKEDLNDNVVRAIMYKVIAEERNFLRKDNQKVSDIVKKHMATIKEYANVDSKH